MQVATNRLKLDATDQVATNRHAGDIGTNHARQASSSTRPTMQVATNRLAGGIDSTCQATLEKYSSNAIGLYISRIYQPWVPGHTVLDARTYVNINI